MNTRPSVLPLTTTRVALIGLALLLPACSSGGGGSGQVGPGPGPTRAPQTAVFLTSDGTQILGAPDDGSRAPVALSQQAKTRVLQFAVSPDGGAVAYVADGDTLDRHELYVREIGGGTPVRVSQLMNPVDDVMDFVWAPDSRSVAYRADAIIDDRAELFRVQRDGTGHYRVYQTGFPNIFVADDYGWSPDSRWLYCLHQQVTTHFELLLHDASTSAEGATRVLFVQPGRQIVDVGFSPDSRWISFRSDHAASLAIGPGQFQVYRRRTDLSGPVLVSNGNPSTTVKITEYAWSPDSLWLAEKVNALSGNDPVGINLYDVTADTSTRILTTTSFHRMAWAPGRNLLAVAADFEPSTGQMFGKERVLVFDVAATMLTVLGTPPAGATLRGDVFEWAPDSTAVAYVTRETSTFHDHVWLAAPTGMQSPIRVTGVNDRELFFLGWSPDSKHLGLLDLDQTQAFHPGEWHIVGRDGIATGHSGGANTYDTSRTMRWSSDSLRAVFAEAANGIGMDTLRSMRADGSGATALGGPAAITPLFEVAVARLP